MKKNLLTLLILTIVVAAFIAIANLVISDNSPVDHASIHSMNSDSENNNQFQDKQKIQKDFSYLSPIKKMPSILDSMDEKLKTKAREFLDNLYSSGFSFDKVTSLYNMIVHEEDETIRHELVMTFFESFSQAEFSADEYSKIQRMALELIANDATRSMAIRQAGQILDDIQMENFFSQYEHTLSEENKQILVQQYTNFRIMNGKSPFNHSGMAEIYNNMTPNQEHDNKVNAMISMISRQDQNHAEEVAEKNVIDYQDWNEINGNIYDFIPWVRAKSLSMKEEDRRNFLHDQFTKSSFHFKNEFFISGLDLVSYIPFDIISNHIEELNVLYLQAIYSQKKFRAFEISGILNIFRSIMRHSSDIQLKRFVDSKIKESINTYPSYPGATQALQMIRDENIYLEQAGFNINEYILDEDNNVEKKEINQLW